METKKKHLLQELSNDSIKMKMKSYYSTIEHLNQGINCIFHMQDFEKYIDYVNPQNAKCKVNQEGSLLLKQIDQQCKESLQLINTEFHSFYFVCSDNAIDKIKETVNF